MSARSSPPWLRSQRRLVVAGVAVALVGSFAFLAMPAPAERKLEETAAADRRPTETDLPQITIFAAASVSDVVAQVATDVFGRGGFRLNAAATSTLARQLSAGASADVFVSADERWMQEMIRDGWVVKSKQVELASNHLVVAVSAQRKTTLTSQMFPPGRLAFAESSVPLGAATDAALTKMGVLRELLPRVVRASSARSALEWVAEGETDAGVLYASDAARDARVFTAWRLPANVTPRLVVVAAPTSTASPRAQLLLDALAGPRGRAAFSAAKFGAPPTSAAVAIAPPPAVDVDTNAAVGRSLLVALLAMLLCAPIAIGAGALLARHSRRGAVVRSALSVVLLIPLALPPVVTGWLLLVALGERGLQSSVPFTLAACVAAAAVVSLPLFAITARTAFESIDPRLAEVAMTLGEAPPRVFWRVTLPLAAPGLGAGALLAFARGLGEFGATVIVAGNTEGKTRTLALAVDALLDAPQGRGEVARLVLIAVGMTLVLVVAYEALTRWQRERRGDF